MPLRIGLLGFGTVGSAFAEVLAASGADVAITHVFNRGVERKKAHPRATFVPGNATWTERVEDVISADNVDLVVELMGGLDPVEGWLRTAIESGKHVVTANKQLIAYRGSELFALAAGKGVQLLYGAPGISLTKVWFKSGFPLPLHSHSGDCLYHILAGNIKMGTEELGPGDGFFVGNDVPYTYTAGPEGVEVLEFRNTNDLNIRFMSRNKTFWEKAGKKIAEKREVWKREQPPSALVKDAAAE